MTGITLVFDVTHENINQAPRNALLAGYVTGSSKIVWTMQDWAAHPRAVRIDQSPVNTTLDETADVIDFENGAATLPDLPGWVRGARANFFNNVRPGQRRPMIYASLNNITPVVNTLVHAGITSGVSLWVAHWGVSEVQAAADVMAAAGPFPVHAFQFANMGAFDADVFDTTWLNDVSGVKAPPPPPPAAEDALMIAGPFAKQIHGVLTTLNPQLATSTDGGKTWH